MFSQRFDGFDPQTFNKTKDRPLGPTEGLLFDVDCKVNPQSRYLVKGIISPGNFVALYGPSGVGKTFVALRLAYAVARGEPVLNRRVQPAAVLYCGLEGQAGIATRLIGAAAEYGSADKMLAQMTLPLALSKAEGEAGVKLIVDRAHALAALAGEATGLIVVDTVHRALAGDDENSAADMSAFIARVSAITAQTGAAVLVVHHCGKDAGKGMRGSSSLFAACDAVIAIDDAKNITLEKVKDGADGPLCSYSLKLVPLGVDADGDPVTTRVVDVITGDTKAKTNPRKLTPQAQRALEILTRMIGDGEAVPATAADMNLTNPALAKLPVAFKDEAWRARCEAARLSNGEAETEGRAYRRARELCVHAGHVGWHGDFVWLIGTGQTGGQARTEAETAENTGVSTFRTSPDEADKRPAGPSVRGGGRTRTPPFRGRLVRPGVRAPNFADVQRASCIIFHA